MNSVRGVSTIRNFVLYVAISNLRPAVTDNLQPVLTQRPRADRLANILSVQTASEFAPSKTQDPKPKPRLLPCVFVRPKHALFRRRRFGSIFDDACADRKIQYLLPTFLIHVAPGGHSGGDHRVSQVEDVVFEFCFRVTVCAQRGFERAGVAVIEGAGARDGARRGVGKSGILLGPIRPGHQHFVRIVGQFRDFAKPERKQDVM